MRNEEFESNLLYIKKQRFRDAVRRASEALNLTKELTINFWKDRCPEDTGNEIAHIHPETGTICIAEDRLKELTYEDIEETATHEVAHMIQLGHNPSFHHAHTRTKVGAWRPPEGVLNIIGAGQHPKLEKVYKKREKKITSKVCHYHLCRKPRKLYKCKYCKELFCKEHLRPKIPGMPRFKSTRPEDKKFMREWRKLDGHPCPLYINYYEEEKRQKKREENEAFNRFLQSKESVQKESSEPWYSPKGTINLKNQREYEEPEIKGIEPEYYEKKEKYNSRGPKVVFLKPVNNILFISMVLLVILALSFILFKTDIFVSLFAHNCSDGTLYDQCSINKPYYCLEGELIKKPNTCGCPENYKAEGEDCIKIQRCVDKTIYGECSKNKPSYCLMGTLVSKASLCGCPEGKIAQGDNCVS